MSQEQIDDEYFDDEEINETIETEEPYAETTEYEDIILKNIELNANINAQTDLIMLLLNHFNVPVPKGHNSHYEYFNSLKACFYEVEAADFLKERGFITDEKNDINEKGGE